MSQSVETTMNILHDILITARRVIDEEASSDGKSGVRITELALRVGERVGKTDAEMYHILKMLIDNSPDLEIRRGRQGGIYKVVRVTEGDTASAAAAQS